jgi:hypothetical protein
MVEQDSNLAGLSENGSVQRQTLQFGFDKSKVKESMTDFHVSKLTLLTQGNTVMKNNVLLLGIHLFSIKKLFH